MHAFQLPEYFKIEQRDLSSEFKESVSESQKLPVCNRSSEISERKQRNFKIPGFLRSAFASQKSRETLSFDNRREKEIDEDLHSAANYGHENERLSLKQK